MDKLKRNLVKNKELWQELIELDKELNVKYVKVKGHDGNKLNEIADFEVNRAMDLWENKKYKIRRGCMEFELKKVLLEI
ncbi:Rnase H [Staphylococcus phage S-CoN_Ph17]|nr:Rnase H [Staphylococcus phage S-CoN_Ph17]